MHIYQSAEELIGNTPLVRLNHIERAYQLDAVILAKLEYYNPAGSSKDRIGKAMLDDAEARGLIAPGAVIIEPTSGNTGIGLASVAVQRGYHAIIVMPDTMSLERRKLIAAYGAELVLTDGAKGMQGSVDKAEELARQIPGSIVAGQFVNPANPEAHRKTTGPEIYRDTDGTVDLFVAGIGTGGTLSGVGEYLKSQKPSVRIIGVEPASSPVLSKGTSGPHKIQGIGANFIPKTLNQNIYDEIMDISDEDSYRFAREVGKTEGFLAGISSGAALAAAVQLAKRPENRGKTIVTLFPDNGDRYLSSDLYD